MDDYIKVLSLDGGGEKGILPSIILIELEKRLGKRISECFDFIAGTSTGGILSLLLSLPPQGKTAEEILGLYTGDDAQKIFKPYMLPWLHGEKYPSSGIETVLENRLGQIKFGDAITDLLLTSYNTETRSADIFYNKDGHSDNMYMKDLARITSAAPTYFEPKNLGENQTYIDGGMFANNPSLCAYAEILKQYPDKKIFMLSIGTGTFTNPLKYDRIKNWNPLQWVTSVIDCLMDGSVDVTDHQMNLILPQDDYYRIQFKLTEATSKMDDVSKKNIEALQKIANDFVKQNNILIDKICTRISSI